MKELIKEWEVATNKLAEAFAKHYFGRDYEAWWVAEDVGGVFYINDHFFNLNTMVDFMKHRYSKAKMYEYYEYQMDCVVKGKTPLNIKSYRQLK